MPPLSLDIRPPSSVAWVGTGENVGVTPCCAGRAVAETQWPTGCRAQQLEQAASEGARAASGLGLQVTQTCTRLPGGYCPPWLLGTRTVSVSKGKPLRASQLQRHNVRAAWSGCMLPCPPVARGQLVVVVDVTVCSGTHSSVHQTPYRDSDHLIVHTVFPTGPYRPGIT